MSDRYQFDVDAGGRLVISLQSGDVEVYPSKDGIEVSLSGKTAGVTVEQVGNTVSIISDKKSSFFTSSSVRVTAGVPIGCDLEISGASLDLVSRQELGAVKAKTASGDIRLTDVMSDLNVKTASGDVRFDTVRGHCEIAAASGDLVGEMVAGDLKASLASGDVRIGRVDGDISVKSASGDAHFDRAEGNDIAVRSMSGDITIGLPTGIKLDFDLDALSGDVNLPPPAATPPPPAPESGSHPGQHLGEPGPEARRRAVRVYAKTVSGDINIERAV